MPDAQNIAKELLDMWAFVSEDLDPEQQEKLKEWITPIIWQWGLLTPAERDEVLDRLKIYAQDLLEGRTVLPPWARKVKDKITDEITDKIETKVKKSMAVGMLIGGVLAGLATYVAMKEFK